MQSARPGFSSYIIIFFFNATATTEIYTLSLHDALPISSVVVPVEEAELLLAVRRIVGGVEVDRDPRGPALESPAMVLDHGVGQDVPIAINSRRPTAFSKRESVGCEARAGPAIGSRPTASLWMTSSASRAASLQSA